MKYLTMVLLAIAVLAGCTSMTIKTFDPATGNLTGETVVDSARRFAYSDEDTTLITGQILINDETVQVLAKEATKSKETTVEDKL